MFLARAKRENHDRVIERRHSVAWEKVAKFTDKFEGDDIPHLYAPDKTQDKVGEFQFLM